MSRPPDREKQLERALLALFLDAEDDAVTGHETCQVFARVGKKAAGARLDGREWKEFPCAT